MHVEILCDRINETSLKVIWMNRECSVSGIGSWDWNLKGHSSTYHALYPRAWTVYEGNRNDHFFLVLLLFLLFCFINISHLQSG